MSTRIRYLGDLDSRATWNTVLSPSGQQIS